jgi:hypothetical protein
MHAESEHTLVDAEDAFYIFDDEQGNIFDDDDRLLFCEGFNQGMEAMTSATEAVSFLA